MRWQSKLKRFTDQKSLTNPKRVTCCLETERKRRKGIVKAMRKGGIGDEETKRKGRKRIVKAKRERRKGT